MSESQFTPSQSWIDAHRDVSNPTGSPVPPPSTPDSHRKAPLTLLERISPSTFSSPTKGSLISPGRRISTRLIDRIAPPTQAPTNSALGPRIGMASTCASPTSHLPSLQAAPNPGNSTSSPSVTVQNPPSNLLQDPFDDNTNLQEPQSPTSTTSENAVDKLLASAIEPFQLKDIIQDGVAEAAPSQGRPSPMSPSILDRFRQLLLPAIFLNIKLRDPGSTVDQEAVAARVLDKMSDEYCNNLILQARDIVAQVDAAKLKRKIQEEDSNTGKRRRGSEEGEILMEREGSTDSNRELSRLPPGADALSVGGSPKKDPPRAPKAMLRAWDAPSYAGGGITAGDFNPDHTDDPLVQMDVTGQPLSADVTSEVNLQEPGHASADSSVHADISPELRNYDEFSSNSPLDGAPATAGHDLDVAVDTPSTPKPVSRNMVPGLWFVKVGKPNPQVFDIEFEVDQETAEAARRWGHRNDTYDPGASHVSVHLLCLRKADVDAFLQALDPEETSESITKSIWNLEMGWPKAGVLAVHVNPGSKDAQAWIPRVLLPDHGPLDIAASLLPGLNTIRLIQLMDLSKLVFVLHASRPEVADLQRLEALHADKRDWNHYRSTIVLPFLVRPEPLADSLPVSMA